MTGPSTFGMRCLKMIVQRLNPSESAASTNSCLLKPSTCARTIRDIVNHSTAPMARKSNLMSRSNTDINTITKMVNGMAYKISTNRIMKASTLPPR